MVGNTILDVLQSHGFKIDWVQNAEDALQRFETQRYDLVLTDVELPRTDGIELLRQLREFRPEVPVVVMSGSGAIDPGSLLLDARDDGAAAVLTKPFRFSELVQVLHRALDEVPVPRTPAPDRMREGRTSEFPGRGRT